MTKKELEKELNEIKEILKNLTKGDNKPKIATTFGEVNVGEQFSYKGMKFTKLAEDLALLDTMDEKWGWCVFDGENNDYDKSVLKEYINTIFLQKVGIELDDLEMFDDNSWAKPLSKEEVEKYREYIRKFKYWSWLRSGDIYDANYACCLSPDGYYCTGYAHYAYAVRPSLHFKSNTLISGTISAEEE